MPVITLILASANMHKVREIRAILGEQWHYLTLRDFADAPSVVEDAATFAGNARKKSGALAHWLAVEPQYNRITPEHRVLFFVLADDSGLEVDAIQGAPGVHSARFASTDGVKADNTPDDANNAKLLGLLKNTPPELRTARFRCMLALTPVPRVTGDARSIANDLDKAEVRVDYFEGICEGHIIDHPRGQGGFGYDPLFVPLGYNQTLAELGDHIKNQISHRAQALAKLRLHLAAK